MLLSKGKESDRLEMAEILIGVSTWLVVAWMTPIGRVTTKAKPKAKSIPHNSSCTSVFHTKPLLWIKSCSQGVRNKYIIKAMRAAYQP